MLHVQEYLKSGKTLEALKAEHGIKFHIHNKKISLSYDQIEAKESDPLAQQCRGLILREGTYEVVACPMFRFFNIEQKELAADVDYSSAVFEDKLDGCFLYNTKLNCWNGSTVKIGDVVSKKLKPTLIGMDENGNLVPTKVVNWHDNGTKDNWMEIELDCLVSNSSGSGNHTNKLRVTTNHSIFLNGEFQPALNTKINDTLITYENVFSKKALHVIKSSLLGDGSLSTNGSAVRFEEGHTFKHSELTNCFKVWLGNNISINKYSSGFGSKMLRASSISLKSLNSLRDEWYKSGKKKVPEDLDWIDDFTIAKWYMDDGSLAHNDQQKDRALFATNGFDEDDVERLANKLHEIYGVDCTVYNSKGWCLRINAGRGDEIEAFWNAIAPHVIPCMRYKLPEHHRKSILIEREPGKLEKNKKETKVLSVKMINDLSKKNFPFGRKGFDITTTVSNYMANNIIVHNSLMIVYFDDFQKKWCVGTRSRPEANGTIDDSDYTFAKLFDAATVEMFKDKTANIQSLMNDANKNYTYCFELTSPFNRIVCQYDDIGLTLLATRDITDLQEIDIDDVFERMMKAGTKFSDVWSALGVKKPEQFAFNNINHMIQVVRDWDPREKEGIVIRDANFNRIKVKNPAYIAYNHMRDSLATSWRGCVAVILLGKDDDVIGMMPEMIADRIRTLKPIIQKVLKQTQEDYDELKDLESMKDYALEARERLWPGALFALKRGKTKDLQTFALGNVEGVTKIPTNATKSMLSLCITLEPSLKVINLEEEEQE